MGQVVDFRAPPPARDPDEVRAWDEMVRLRQVAEDTPSMRNMVAAVRAWETWVCLVIHDEAGRRSLLS